ncbi:cellulose binding domain-containing protein [Actinoallomurus vinaceus]|uniref:Cellulose binding domain-containing protein n=1 Tax=Actinoallomurus vinaceus TaxID=1080074 RepID=A0ABP8UXR1_9ACTN
MRLPPALRRLAPGRRRTALLTALVLFGATVVTAGLLTGGPAQAASSLQLQYRTTETGATAGDIEPWFQVVNTGSSSASLSGVTIRYYFSADTTVPYVYTCEWAVIGCSKISGTVGALSGGPATADHYLEVAFGPSAGSLAPGASTGDLQLRLNRQDWQQVNQANDYSFKNQTSYGSSGTVTLSVDGTVVSGTAPGGTSTPPTSGSGVLFDDFHYTGPSDPNLGAHGWSIRTGGGGPGIQGTWSANAFSFPSDSTAQGGKVMNLAATTDGTTNGTTQAEIDTVQRKFFEGTYAARVYFNDAPTTGPNGDHVNETFYTITPDDSLYSELDNEYLPNGGWGAPGPTLYTTTWYSADAMDRQTHNVISSLQGWHTLQMTVAGGTVTYYVDGNVYFSTTGKYYPREKMTIDFNEWFIDLPFSGARTWNEKVNWVYYNASGALTPAQVTSAVNGYYSAGTHFTDTVPKSASRS